MNRKWAFVSLWSSCAIMRLLDGTHGAFNLVFGSAVEAFSIPGWLPFLLIGHFVRIAMDGPATLAACLLALLFWFFPVARVRRWFGTFDAVSVKGKWRFPSVWRAAASMLDTLRRLQVGKGKMGGWA